MKNWHTICGLLWKFIMNVKMVFFAKCIQNNENIDLVTKRSKAHRFHTFLLAF